MRKLKLQVQISVDGFVGGPNGELDWMTWNMDDQLAKFINELTDSSDTILLGKNMTDGFVTYWTNVLNDPSSPEYSFAKKMVETPKVVFSKTLEKSNWENTTLANGDLTEEVNNLKNKPGKDIIVYGGANFVSHLIDNNLIDELNLFVNPAAIGNGMRIFNGRVDLEMQKSVSYPCGIVVNTYSLRNK